MHRCRKYARLWKGHANPALHFRIGGLDTRVVLSLIHISEPTRLALISYAVFCLKKKNEYFVLTVSTWFLDGLFSLVCDALEHTAVSPFFCLT